MSSSESLNSLNWKAGLKAESSHLISGNLSTADKAMFNSLKDGPDGHGDGVG
jgi:hypothetical protein